MKIGVKMICVISAILLIFNCGLFSIMYNVYATDGVSGNYTYKLDENDNAIITKYTGQETNITIPKILDGKNVVKIDEKAFYQNTTIQSVTIPDTITIIGGLAFFGCKNLSNVQLSKSLTELGGYAFGDCDKLTSIEIPKSLKKTTKKQHSPYAYSIIYGVFIASDNLKNITFEQGITKIPEGLFAYNSSIERIVLPDTVTEIGNNAFEKCTNLKEIQLSNNLETIGEDAFSEAEALTEINIPNTVTKIGAVAFFGCKNLSNVQLSKSLTELGGYAFGDCDSLTSIEIPKSLKKTTKKQHSPYALSIIYGVFIASDNLKNITFEQGITKIPEGLFAYNSSIEKIVLPDTVTEIGNNAFEKCTNLKEIQLSNNLETIGEDAFSGAEALTEIIIPNTVTKIGAVAFFGCKNLSNVKLSKSLTELGGYAFGDCDSLTSIEIPKSLKNTTKKQHSPYALSIIYGVFIASDNLKNITFEQGITQIPEGLFAYNSSVEKIILPDTVTDIGNNAFEKCTNLKEIKLSNNLQTIGKDAFKGSEALTEINIPNTVTKIGAGAFYRCKKLSKVQLSKSLTELGGYAFGDCDSLTSIEIPKSLKKTTKEQYDPYIYSILYGVFIASDNLKNITFEEGTTEIAEGLFAYNSSIEEIVLPETIEKIGTDAFKKSNINIFCNKYIKGIKDLIDVDDQDFNIRILNEKYEDNEDIAIIKKDSEYQVKMDSTENGYIPVKLKYAIKHNIYDEISDKKINIKIPKDTEIHASGIYLDSESISNYKYDKKSRILSIPVERQTGTINLNLNVLESTKVQSYVELSYKRNNKNYSDLIEVVIEENATVTISAQEEANTDTVNVTGVGPKGQNIKISVDGQEDINVKTSNTTGRYSADVKINDSMNYYETDITATTQTGNDEEFSATTTVRYNERTPELKSFIMNYSDHSNKTIDLIEYQNSRKALNFYPKKPLSFELNFENANNIDEVYVVSTRNGVKKYLEATYNPNTKKYYANGFFDNDNNATYVPGAISYEYTLKKDESLNQANLPIEDTIIYKAAKEAIESEKIKIEQVENEELSTNIENILNKANIKHGKVTTKQFDIGFVTDKIAGIPGTPNFKGAKLVQAVLENIEDYEQAAQSMGIGIEAISAGANILKYTTKDGKLHFNVDFSDPYSITSLVYDVTSNKLIKYTLGATENGADIPIVGLSETLNEISPGIKIVKNLYELDHKRDDIEKKILASNMTDEEKSTALECARRMDIFRRGDFVLGTILTTAAAIDPATFKVMSAAHDFIMGTMFYLSEKSIIGEYAIADSIASFMVGATKITGTTFLLKWIIDPSGYVYEAIPTNRLEGVKCTVYYKEKEDSTPVIWNATEYEQDNPLYTDENGKYAWDVPEGLWQVKYEKTGYETKYSEWLPVPPPQTDVNISMVSKAKPTVTKTNIYDTNIEIEFDKYMDVDTLSTKSISLKNKNNANLEFTVEYVNKALDENGKYISNKIILSPKNNININENYTITINSNAKSYSGTAMDNYTYTDKAKKAPNIKCDENISLELNEEKNITITIENLNSGKLAVSSTDGAITVKQSEVQINNGKATILLKGISKGNSIITMQLHGTNISKNIYAICDGGNEESQIVLPEKSINVGIGRTYKLNPVLYPTNLEQKFTYKSYNTEIASVNANGEIKGIKEGKTTIVVQSSDGKAFQSIDINVIKAKIAYLKGDVNGDGKVNGKDWNMMYEHINETKILTEVEFERADINGDGKVNGKDWNRVYEHINETNPLW